MPNGECRIEFEIDDTFKENFKKMYGLKRMSRKAFSRFVLEALSSALGEVEDA